MVSKQVLTQATRQVRDTLTYLDGRSVEIRNHRGHLFTLDIGSIQPLHKLIVYLPHEKLPESRRNLKYHRSKTAGLIHIIPANDYLVIVRTLLTPTEVADYLQFRETLIDKWEREILGIPEPALVGQYLIGDISDRPTVKFIEDLQRLYHRSDEWDISGIISKYSALHPN